MAEEHIRVTDQMLTDHINKEEEKFKDIDRRFDRIEVNLAQNSADTKEILEAFTKTKGAITFIKVLAWLGSIVGAVYLFLVGNFTITPK